MSDTTTPANNVETATLAYTAFLEAKNEFSEITNGFPMEANIRIALRAQLFSDLDIRSDSIDLESMTYEMELMDGKSRTYLLIQDNASSIDIKLKDYLENNLETFTTSFIAREFSVSEEQAEHLRECGSECLYRLATRLNLLESMTQSMVDLDGLAHFFGVYDHSHEEMSLDDFVFGAKECYLVFRQN